MNDLISLCSLLLNVLLMVYAFLDKFGQRAKKAYAAEREFGHLKRNQENFIELLKLGNSELEETKNSLRSLEIKLDYWLKHIADVQK